MNPRALIPLFLLTLGCHGKIRKYAGSIESMSVFYEDQAMTPTVSLGRVALEGDDPTSEAVEAASNITIEIFEVELATRLTTLLDSGALTSTASDAAGSRLDRRGPYALDPESRWELHILLQSFGIQADSDDPVNAYVQVQGVAYGPKGKRIWRKTRVCTERLAGDTYGSGGQVAVNIGTIRGTKDEQLQAVFRDLAKQCGQEVADKLYKTHQKVTD